MEAPRVYGDTVYFDLWYPRSKDRPTYLQLGLADVRVSDDIRISYDFERDGWKIEQSSGWDDVEGTDGDWQEVAFVQAWGRYPHDMENVE
jgi:hypothetical protein